MAQTRALLLAALVAAAASTVTAQYKVTAILSFDTVPSASGLERQQVNAAFKFAFKRAVDLAGCTNDFPVAVDQVATYNVAAKTATYTFTASGNTKYGAGLALVVSDPVTYFNALLGQGINAFEVLSEYVSGIGASSNPVLTPPAVPPVCSPPPALSPNPPVPVFSSPPPPPPFTGIVSPPPPPVPITGGSALTSVITFVGDYSKVVGNFGTFTSNLDAAIAQLFCTSFLNVATRPTSLTALGNGLFSVTVDIVYNSSVTIANTKTCSNFSPASYAGLVSEFSGITGRCFLRITSTDTNFAPTFVLTNGFCAAPAIPPSPPFPPNQAPPSPPPGSPDAPPPPPAQVPIFPPPPPPIVITPNTAFLSKFTIQIGSFGRRKLLQNFQIFVNQGNLPEFVQDFRAALAATFCTTIDLVDVVCAAIDGSNLILDYQVSYSDVVTPANNPGCYQGANSPEAWQARQQTFQFNGRGVTDQFLLTALGFLQKWLTGDIAAEPGLAPVYGSSACITSRRKAIERSELKAPVKKSSLAALEPSDVAYGTDQTLFEAFTQRLSFDDAQAVCNARGAKLAGYDNEATQVFVDILCETTKCWVDGKKSKGKCQYVATKGQAREVARQDCALPTQFICITASTKTA